MTPPARLPTASPPIFPGTAPCRNARRVRGHRPSGQRQSGGAGPCASLQPTCLGAPAQARRCARRAPVRGSIAASVWCSTGRRPGRARGDARGLGGAGAPRTGAGGAASRPGPRRRPTPARLRLPGELESDHRAQLVRQHRLDQQVEVVLERFLVVPGHAAAGDDDRRHAAAEALAHEVDRGDAGLAVFQPVVGDDQRRLHRLRVARVRPGAGGAEALEGDDLGAPAAQQHLQALAHRRLVFDDDDQAAVERQAEWGLCSRRSLALPGPRRLARPAGRRWKTEPWLDPIRSGARSAPASAAPAA